MIVPDALRILNLKANFSEHELKKSYKKEIKYWHPDIASHRGISNEISTRKSQEIISAYEILVKINIVQNFKQASKSRNGTYKKSYQHKESNYRKWDETKRKSKYNVIDDIDDLFANKDIVKSSRVKWMIFFERSNNVLVRFKRSGSLEFIIFNDVNRHDYVNVLNSNSVGSAVGRFFEKKYAEYSENQILVVLKERGLI